LNTSINTNNIPANISGNSIVHLLGKAFTLYANEDAVIVMVVQPTENNILDQGYIQSQLYNLYKIKVIRKTLLELSNSKLINDKLFIDGLEVAITYFRAGYSPNDYPTENEWKAREIIEQSTTIKLPNTAYHLVGAKKIQQVLAGNGVLEQFLNEEQCKDMRTCFTGLYPLDDSPEGKEAYQDACLNPMKYVLKPQREGGGICF
jgi:glutathione synthase